MTTRLGADGLTWRVDCNTHEERTWPSVCHDFQVKPYDKLKADSESELLRLAANAGWWMTRTHLTFCPGCIPKAVTRMYPEVRESYLMGLAQDLTPRERLRRMRY